MYSMAPLKSQTQRRNLPPHFQSTVRHWAVVSNVLCCALTGWQCPSNTVSARAFSESLLHREVNYSIPEFPQLPSYLFMRPGMVSHKMKKLLRAALDPFR